MQKEICVDYAKSLRVYNKYPVTIVLLVTCVYM